MSPKQDRWEKGLEKSRKGLFGRVTALLQNKKGIDGDLLEELEAVLIESDVGVETAFRLLDRVRTADYTGSGQDLKMAVRGLLRTALLEMLRCAPQERLHTRPWVVLVAGVNGTGKTTTIGKLAHVYRSQGYKVLLAGADTFRAAAGEQLKIWGDRAGADVITQGTGGDPAAVVYDTLDAAVARGVDLVLVDTAGRLHTRINLMEELKKIRRVMKKRIETAPHETLLVLDATTGQNGLHQARQFADAVGVSGVVLTKLDGTARGGIVVAIQEELNIPVQWVGVGEGLDDLLPFDAEAFVDGILGGA